MTHKPDIAPRYDDDGVPWCTYNCPELDRSGYEQYDPSTCKITRKQCLGSICPVAVERMAAELKAAKKLERERWEKARKAFLPVDTEDTR